MRSSIALTILWLLAGCGHVPVPAMIELAQLDPLTVDAREIRVAVRMPVALRAKPDGVEMIFGATRKRPNKKMAETFILAEAENPNLTPALRAAQKPGFHIAVFRIAESDLYRLEAVRARIREWKADKKGETEGVLSVNASGCWRDQPVEGPVPVSTFLKLDRGSDFFVMTRDIDLFDMIAAEGGAEGPALCRDADSGKM